jgi:putative ABC transport system permease protein
VFTAALVLGLAAGSRPIFSSSASSAALADDQRSGCPFRIGLRVERQVGVVPDPLERWRGATEALDQAVAREGVQVERTRTLLGDTATVRLEGDAGGGTFVQLVARTSFEDHIEVVGRGGGQGVWLPAFVAETLGVAPGDTVEVQIGDRSRPVEVAGVFVDLTRSDDAHWCTLSRQINDFQGRQPPPVALIAHEDLLQMTHDAGIDRIDAWWEYSPTGGGWTLDRAAPTIRHLADVAEDATNRADPLAHVLGPGRTSVDQTDTLEHATRVASTVDAATGPVALGTAGVAVLVLLSAGRTWIDRRRQEMTVLAMRGASPSSLAVKALLEMSGPLLAGAAAGLIAAGWVAREAGPSRLVASGAVEDALLQVALVTVGAAIVLGVAIGMAVRRVGTSAGGVQARATLLWWEPAVLAVAGAALYQLRSNARADEAGSLLLVFPVLFIAGAAGLGARLLLAPGAQRWVASRLPVAGWLAIRRLLAGRVRVTAIVTGVALAIGMVAFAGSVATSLRVTTEAKALLGPGARQTIGVPDGAALPDGVGDDGTSTEVVRASEVGVLQRGHTSADVLGVDPATFPDGALWDDSFASASLEDLVAELSPEAGASGVAAIGIGGGLPDELVLTLGTSSEPVEVPVEIVARAEAFPGLGYRSRRPLVVVHRAVLEDLEVGGREVWVSNTSSEVADRMTDAGAAPRFVTRPAENLPSELVAQLWAIDYLHIVGPAAGLVAGAGLALYLASAARARALGAAMAAHMGMRRRTGVLATGVETTAMTLAGWALGVALAWIASRLVLPALDPVPVTAPDAIFRFEGAIVVTTAALAIGVAALATAVVERPASHQTLPEVTRGA